MMVDIIETNLVKEPTNIGNTSIPKWLDEQFLEESLRNHYKTDIKVINFVTKSTAGKVNFASSLYRVCVTFAFVPKNSSLIESSVRFCEKMHFLHFMIFFGIFETS